MKLVEPVLVLRYYIPYAIVDSCDVFDGVPAADYFVLSTLRPNGLDIPQACREDRRGMTVDESVGTFGSHRRALSIFGPRGRRARPDGCGP
jgi:hypothetical protein